jgi:hypothetical protein
MPASHLEPGHPDTQRRRQWPRAIISVMRVATSDELQSRLHDLLLCQMTVDTLTARSWQSSGILLAGAMAALALMLQVQASDLAAAVISTLFAVGAILILSVWLSFIQRDRRFIKRLTEHMAALETEVGIGHQISITAEPPWRPWWLPWPKNADQTTVLAVTACAVSVGWLLVVAWRWLIYLGALD